MKIILINVFVFMFFNIPHAQELGLAPVKIWTDNREIQNPLGIGIYFFQPIGNFGIKAELVYAENSRSYYGFLNGGFLLAPGDYTTDNISSTSTFRAIEFSGHITKLFELSENYFNAGAGISFDRFTREKKGLGSGKSYSDKENKFGIFFSLSVSREYILSLPLKLELLFKYKGLMGGVFATDIEQPFVGAMEVKELQLNAAYMF